MISLLQKLRSFFLSPDSKFELWLRTQYHRLNQTRLFFQLQDWLAKRSYNRWRKYQNAQSLDNPESFENQPKISFLLAFGSNSKHELNQTVESIQNIKGENWEIILVSEESNITADLKENLLVDKRIKILNSKWTALVESITVEYIIICQAGDIFFPGLLVHFYSALSDNNSADWYYYDCEYIDDQTGEINPLFKPQSLSPALLLSLNYLSRGFIRPAFLQQRLSSNQSFENLINKEYELAHRLCENEGNSQHISQVLIKQMSLVEPDSPEIQDTLISHLSRMGLKDVSAQKKSNGTRFTWRTNEPSVAIIIPTKNHYSLLQPCLDSIIDKTSYKNFIIHLVDNNSKDPETLAFYEQLYQKPNIRIHSYPKAFNYSEAINLGAAKSDSDLILFLNDDMEILDPDWLTELVQWAVRPKIGVVGGKLIRGNHTVQHAGIILGLTGFVGHLYLNASEDYHGLIGSVDWFRNFLAVTGAMQMMRREIFEEVGRYDENYQIAFGDIDFCLRVYKAGYQIIYTPHAKLYHYEGSSRGYITPIRDVLKGLTDFRKYLINEDPFFSPNLTYSRIPKCQLGRFSKDKRIDAIEERKKFYSASS
jgi:GT2 family glycosyltransferase